MKKRKDLIKMITLNGMVATVYAVLTLMIQPLAYRELQLRLSEIVVLLAFYNKKLIPGLAIGCFIANIPSPLGIIDWIVGPLSTLVVCYFMNRVTNIYLSALIGSLATGLIIGGELCLVYHIPYLINALYVFIGEAIVLYLGTVVFKRLEKNVKFIEYIKSFQVNYILGSHHFLFLFCDYFYHVCMYCVIMHCGCPL